MHQPYFYIIQHIDSGKYYAGSKWSKTPEKHHHKKRYATPEHFMIEEGYLTSSNIVKKIISEEGISAFKVRTIKVFESGSEARQYEARFLKRVKAKTNDAFLNKHENTLIAWGTDEFKEACLKKYGVEHPSQSDEVHEKLKAAVKEKHGVEYGFLLEKSRETMLDRYGVEYSMQSAEVQETRRNNALEKYGVDHPMKGDALKDKVRAIKLEKYGATKSPGEIKSIIDRTKNKAQRKTVLEVIELKNIHNLKLGRNWWMKSDSDIDLLLQNLRAQYGDISVERLS